MEAWGSGSPKARLVSFALGVLAVLAMPSPARAAFKPVAEFGSPRLGELVGPIDVERDGGGNAYVLGIVPPAVTKYDPAGTPVARFGAFGTAPGELESPTALGVNEATGDVYIADLSEVEPSITIQHFDSDGTFLGEWGSVGSAEGQFSQIIFGIAVNQGTGDVYVAEQSRVQRFSAGGQFELMWGKDVAPGGGTGAETCAAGCQEGAAGTAEGEFDEIAGIATTGNIVFVSEAGNDRVQRFNATTGAFGLMAGRDVDPAGGMGPETCAAGCQRGITGSGPGELDGPAGLDVNGTTVHLWVADQGNHRVQRWDSVLMTYQAEFGSEGAGVGQFERPMGLVESGGSVLVADIDLNRVQRFDSATSAFQAAFGTPGAGTVVFPTGVAAGPGGLYVTDNLNRALRFDLAGGPISRFGGLGSGPGEFDIPAGIAVAADGTVYVADRENNRIERFDAAGTFLGEWGATGAGAGQFADPADVAVAPDGTIYVADTGNDRIQRFDGVGSFVSEFGSAGDGAGQLDGPNGVAVGPDGAVYVADTNNDRVQKFGADGAFVTAWGRPGTGVGQFTGPRDLAVDGGGNVFVADSENNRIERFDSRGAFIESVGANGGVGTSGDGPGEFHLPFGIATDALGFVYVADTFNNRIQRLVGEPELRLTGKRRQPYKRPKVVVDCATGPCDAVVSGKVKTKKPRRARAARVRKSKLKLRSVELSLATGGKATAKLRFRHTKRSKRILESVLGDGGRAKLTVRARATNEAGAGRTNRHIKLRRR